METSSHTVFLGTVLDGDVLDTFPAMTYAYYHNVIKGKSPKNAPTYLPEEDPADMQNGSAVSADMSMTATFLSRTSPMTTPVRYAGSQNPNSSKSKK